MLQVDVWSAAIVSKKLQNTKIIYTHSQEYVRDSSDKKDGTHPRKSIARGNIIY